MFVTHGIPYFFELLRKYIHNFSHRISLDFNPIITFAWHPLCLYIHPSGNGGDQYSFNNYFVTVKYLCIDCMYVFFIMMFLLCIWTNV